MRHCWWMPVIVNLSVICPIVLQQTTNTKPSGDVALDDQSVLDFNMDTHAKAMSKDKAAYEAEQEWLRAKAQRKQEREAIRERRRLQEEHEANAAATTQEADPIMLQASSPEELQKLVSNLHVGTQPYMTITPGQGGVFAQQGIGGTATTIAAQPILMTPEQATAFQSQHS